MEPVKLISWNVNGLRAIVGKGFADIFNSFDADFVCLQETKLKEGQIDLEFPGYTSYWNYADRPGYSGTVVYSRLPVISVHNGMDMDIHDHEGRVETLELAEFFLVNVYVPNSQEGLRRLDYRMQWEDDFRAYLGELNKRKPVVVCGDFNVAHNEIDIKNPSSNHQSAGFTDAEREKMTQMLNSGFIDTWRYQHPEEVKYSWWSYRGGARFRNAGWRIDYFLVSESLKSHIDSTQIYTDIMGSDHCPVGLILK